MDDKQQFTFDIRIVPDQGLPGFAAYLAGEKVDPIPEFRVNFGAIFTVCAKEGFKWEEELADCVVHELLHLVQHQFGRAFDELEIDKAIEEARKMDRPEEETMPISYVEAQESLVTEGMNIIQSLVDVIENWKEDEPEGGAVLATAKKYLEDNG